MEKYSLEVSNWGDWELEKDFASIPVAIRYARDRFSQNEWRVIDRRTGEVVHSHDSNAEIETTARAEVARFQNTERWRTIFAERAASAVVASQQRERMAEVAARQRARQREQEQARRERLRGFNFVGATPEILRAPRFPQWEDDMLDLLPSEDRPRRGQFEHVNWLKEGF